MLYLLGFYERDKNSGLFIAIRIHSVLMINDLGINRRRRLKTRRRRRSRSRRSWDKKDEKEVLG